MAIASSVSQQQRINGVGTMLVSFFAYFHPTCSEIIEAQLRVLGDHVDHWVITESNLTHAGHVAIKGLRQRLDELSWPRDQVTIIDLDIPADADLEIQQIDHYNTYESFSKHKLGSGDLQNIRARARERLQKDSLLAALHRFPKDTVFLHSDCDEIIDPRHLAYLTQMTQQNPDVVIKVPLVYLQGRADLRTHVKETGKPVDWDGGMFLAMKSHFDRATPTQIRSTNLNPWPIRYITQDGMRCEDLGWHFSWMGTAQQRLAKSQNFTHYHDDLSWLATPSYDSPQHKAWILSQQFKNGDIPPSGDQRHVLMPYDIVNLPAAMVENTALREYLLPESRDLDLV